MLPIDWLSEESHIFRNPRAAYQLVPSNWELFNSFPGHIWIATSGTTQSNEETIKWVAASKKAFLVSANAVNAHLKCTKEDIWLNALPTFHVGGLSIYARAYLSNSKVVEFNDKWNKKSFVKSLKNTKATLTSLVPAQIHDLVSSRLEPSSHLRMVIIGGGALPHSLYLEAKKLKWPVIPTFGMSECCSQIATGNLEKYELKILPHIKGGVSKDGLFEIQSDALLTGYLMIKRDQFSFKDPKINGVFTSQDKVEIQNGFLKFLGRESDWIKIGGENVSLFHLENFLNKIKPEGIDAILASAIDCRLENVIELVILNKHASQVTQIMEAFNDGVMPYERIRKVRYVDVIPRTELGKIIRSNDRSAFSS